MRSVGARGSLISAMLTRLTEGYEDSSSTLVVVYELRELHTRRDTRTWENRQQYSRSQRWTHLAVDTRLCGVVIQQRPQVLHEGRKIM